jgi:hypothetical protein
LKKPILIILIANCLLAGNISAQSIEPPIPNLIAPTATASQANPFVNSVLVTLQSENKNDRLFYDLNNEKVFDTATAFKYEDVPVSLTETTVFRAVACSPSLKECSTEATFKFIKDLAPTVTLASPVANQVIRQGAPLSLFVSNAVDPDGTVTHVHYARRAAGTLTWEDLGQGTEAPKFANPWTPTAPGTGTYFIRAAAADAQDLEGYSPEVSVTITAENQSPSATLTAPINGANYIGPTNITLTATAADLDLVGGAISSVEFWDGTTVLGSDTQPPYTFDWQNVPNGPHNLKAVAYDNNIPSASGSSAITSITVKSNKAPTVSITSPLDGAFYYAPASDSFRVSATDSDGTISKVELLNGNVVEATDFSPPYVFWKANIAAGTYKLKARAYDNLGAIATSAEVSINVTANQPPVVSAGKDSIIVLPTNSLVLNGTATDPEGTPMTYLWTGPTGASLIGATTLNPTVSFSGTGSFVLTLRATDAGTPASSTSSQVTITVYNKPTITSSLVASGAARQPFTYTMTATGFPTPVLNATSRPPWLNWAPSTGILSGTPPASGSTPVTLTATSHNNTTTATLIITIGDSLTKPTITSPATFSGKVGVLLTYPITAIGSPTITLTTGALPTGLVFTGTTISGTPTVAGLTNIKILAVNPYGRDSITLSLTITADPKITLDLLDTIKVDDKSTATFTVSATGSPAVSYQWEYAGTNGVFIKVGTGTNKYTINPVSPSSAGKYRVTVSNGTGPNVISKASVLIVNALKVPIVITKQPFRQTIVLGKPVTFLVEATGDPTLLCQWFKGTVAVTSPPAANYCTYTNSAVKQTDAALYHAVVTNGNTDPNNAATFAVSDTARLIVETPKLSKPKANPATISFYPQLKVVLYNDTPGTEIRYTLNGTPPNAQSPVFGSKDTLILDSNRVIQAYSSKVGFLNSDVMIETYTYTKPGQTIKPTIRPPALTFKIAMICSLSAPGADIYYTTDGSVPNMSPAQKLSSANGAIPLSATTTIIAIAQFPGKLVSDTLMKTYTLDKPLPKAQDPVANPPGGDFTVNQKVILTSQTDSASISYTTDGSSPETSSTALPYPLAGIILKKTTALKAVSLRKGYTNSGIIEWKFNQVPTISALPVSGAVIDGELTVNLTVAPPQAKIHFTTDGSAPLSDGPEFPIGGLKITETTTIKAIAVLDGIPSSAYTFSYSKKGGQLAAPSPFTIGNASTFQDSIKVSLIATSGSDIYFTLNGDIPLVTPSQLYKTPILIDSTTSIQAIAVQSGFIQSKILIATYTLIPGAPIISPVGGTYASSRKVTLTSSSKKAELFYTLNNLDPTPDNRTPFKYGDTILINSTKTIKAIAVSGNMASAISTAAYKIFDTRDTVLRPGEIYYLEGGYSISNPQGQSAIVHIHLGTADTLKLVGFDGVQYSIKLELATGLQAFYPPPEFPELIFSGPSTEKRSIYKVEPSGRVYYISARDTTTLAQPGTYFLGIDISPPVVTYVDEKIEANDSTNVSFLIEDNIANLTFDIKRNDNPKLNLSQQPILSPGRFSVKLKHPPGTLKPLKIQITASDYQSSGYCPNEMGAFLSLSQSFGALTGPTVWAVGLNPQSPYDFISIPLDLNPSLTLADLGKTQPNKSIGGLEWNNKTATYDTLPSSKVLKAGEGYWIASLSPLQSLLLSGAKTSASGPKKFSVTLKQGWNQIGNPQLDTLYWPVPRTFAEAYRSSTTKGLWVYDHRSADFQESDIMVPWRGYFVYNFIEGTTVELSSHPITSLTLKKAGQATDEISLALGWGKSRTLRLGAAYSSANGLGIEDEAELPQGRTLTYLKALRNGQTLSTDWVRMQRDGIMQWKVAMGGSDDSLPPLRILEQDLPYGFETWAVSKSRGMKFRLVAGQSISASGLAKDTLVIYSGPHELIGQIKGLKGIATVAPDLNLRILSEPGSFSIQVALPSQARIRATVWSLDGTRKGELALGPIAEGTYHFSYASDFRNKRKDLVPGMYFLTLEIHGNGLNSRMSRKIFLNR